MKFAALLKTALSGTHRGTVGQGNRETDYISIGLSHLQHFGKTYMTIKTNSTAKTEQCEVQEY